MTKKIRFFDKVVRLPIVWCLCSPFVFLNLAVYTQVWFLSPSQEQITAVMEQHHRKEVKLASDNEHLRRKYQNLWEEMNYLAGENAGLRRGYDRISLQQAINSPKGDLDQAKTN